MADDHSDIDGTLDRGNHRAREIAEVTLTTVHDLLGMAHANRVGPNVCLDDGARAEPSRA